MRGCLFSPLSPSALKMHQCWTRSCPFLFLFLSTEPHYQSMRIWAFAFLKMIRCFFPHPSFLPRDRSNAFKAGIYGMCDIRVTFPPKAFQTLVGFPPPFLHRLVVMDGNELLPLSFIFPNLSGRHNSMKRVISLSFPPQFHPLPIRIPKKGVRSPPPSPC